MADGRTLHQTISHKERITCLQLSRDSQLLITGSEDTCLKVWQTRTGRLTQVFRLRFACRPHVFDVT